MNDTNDNSDLGDKITEYFATSIDENNHLLSEDYHFCKLARDNGIKDMLASYKEPPMVEPEDTYAISQKKLQEAKPKQDVSKVQANVNVNDNVNENVNVNDNENVNAKVSRSHFRAPAYDEILNFMKEKNSLAGNVWNDAKVVTESKAFFNHYESNGWMVGKNKMKNWEAAVRNWMNNNSKFENNKPNHNEREKRNSELEQFRKQYRSSLASSLGIEDIPGTE